MREDKDKGEEEARGGDLKSDLVVLSWNINGLSSNNPRTSAKLDILKKAATGRRCDCILLQETHLNKEKEIILELHLPDYWWVFSHNVVYSGVAIGIKKRHGIIKEDRIRRDYRGCFIEVETKIKGVEYRIVSAYVRPEESKTPMKVLNNIGKCDEHRLVFGADLNTQLNDEICDFFAKMKSKTLLSNEPTFMRGGTIIDYVAIDERMNPDEIHLELLPGNTNDHNILIASKVVPKKCRLPNRRIPKAVATSKAFHAFIRDRIGEIPSDEKDDQAFYDYLKLLKNTVMTHFTDFAKPSCSNENWMIINEARAVLSKIGKEGTIQLEKSENAIIKRTAERIKTHPKELKGAKLKRRWRCLLRDEIFHYANESRMEMEHLRMERRGASIKITRPPLVPDRLIDPETKEEITDSKERNRVMLEFWEKVFTIERPYNQEVLKEALDENPMTIEENMECRIKEEAIKTAVCKSRQSCPGPDGIPFEFYANTYEWLAPLWKRLCNMAGRSPGIFNAEFAESMIFMIPKKPTPGGPDQYRPITVTNADYRIIMAVWAMEYRRIFEDILSPAQRALLKGRLIDDCIFGLTDPFHCLIEEGSKVFLIQSDFAKAFDYLNRSAIKEVLRRRRTPQELMNVAEIALMDAKSFFIGEPDKLPSFVIRSGVRQGDPLSPLLYIIVFDLFVGQISKIPGVISSYAYMDDMGILTKTMDILLEYKDRLNKYEAATGAKANLFKFIVTTNAIEDVMLGDEWSGATVGNTTQYLGYELSITPDQQKYWAVPIMKAKVNAARIRQTKLSLGRKIAAVNMYIISLFQYHGRFCLPNKEITKKIWKIIRSALGGHKGLPTAILTQSQSVFGMRPAIKNPFYMSAAALMGSPPRHYNDEPPILNSPSGSRAMALRAYSKVTNTRMEIVQKEYDCLIGFLEWKQKVGKKGNRLLYNEMINGVKVETATVGRAHGFTNDQTSTLYHNLHHKCPDNLRNNLITLLWKGWCLNHQVSLYRPNCDPICDLCGEEEQTYIHIMGKCRVLESLIWTPRGQNRIKMRWPGNWADLLGIERKKTRSDFILGLIILKVIRSVTRRAAVLKERAKWYYEKEIDRVMEQNLKLLSERGGSSSEGNRRTAKEAKKRKRGKEDEPMKIEDNIYYVYFDGSHDQESLRSAYGYSICKGQMEMGRGGDSIHYRDIDYAETKGMLEGMKKAREMDIKEICIRGDSTFAIKTGSTRIAHRPGYGRITKEIKETMKFFETIRFEKIPRENNRRADVIAYTACRSPNCMKWICEDGVMERPRPDHGNDFETWKTEKYEDDNQQSHDPAYPMNNDDLMFTTSKGIVRMKAEGMRKRKKREGEETTIIMRTIDSIFARDIGVEQHRNRGNDEHGEGEQSANDNNIPVARRRGGHRRINLKKEGRTAKAINRSRREYFKWTAKTNPKRIESLMEEKTHDYWQYIGELEEMGLGQLAEELRRKRERIGEQESGERLNEG